jgi:hypothetical protein
VWGTADTTWGLVEQIGVESQVSNTVFRGQDGTASCMVWYDSREIVRMSFAITVPASCPDPQSALEGSWFYVGDPQIADYFIITRVTKLRQRGRFMTGELEAIRFPDGGFTTTTTSTTTTTTTTSA